MEFILVIAVIIVLCLIMNVSPGFIALVIMGLIELVLISMLLLFLYQCIRMAFSKRVEAQFTRIDMAPGEHSRFKVAYYTANGEEYPCVFPSEMILNDKMYRTDRTYRVLLNRRMGKVYDIWTILTCILGLITSFLAIYASTFLFSLV